MVDVDVMQVPTFYHNHRYLLVVQDYFSMWLEAIPLVDQTAECITAELVKVFLTRCLPKVLHSDQGRNLESTVLQQTLEAFRVRKSCTIAYHPQGDGMVKRFNVTLL